MQRCKNKQACNLYFDQCVALLKKQVCKIIEFDRILQPLKSHKMMQQDKKDDRIMFDEAVLLLTAAPKHKPASSSSCPELM